MAEWVLLIGCFSVVRSASWFLDTVASFNGLVSCSHGCMLLALTLLVSCSEWAAVLGVSPYLVSTDVSASLTGLAIA